MLWSLNIRRDMHRSSLALGLAFGQPRRPRSYRVNRVVCDSEQCCAAASAIRHVDGWLGESLV